MVNDESDFKCFEDPDARSLRKAENKSIFISTCVYYGILGIGLGIGYVNGVLKQASAPNDAVNVFIRETFGINNNVLGEQQEKEETTPPPKKQFTLDDYLTFLNASDEEREDSQFISEQSEAFQIIANYVFDTPLNIDGIPGKSTLETAQTIAENDPLKQQYKQATQRYRTAKRTFTFEKKTYTLPIPNIALEDLPKEGYKTGARDFTSLRDQAVRDPLLQKLVKKLTYGLKTKEQKAEKLGRFVQSQISYSYELNEYIKHPLETLVDGIGDCDDFTVLVDALFQIAGLETKIVSAARKGEKKGHAFLVVKGNFNGTRYTWDNKKTWFYAFDPTVKRAKIGWVSDRYKDLDDRKKFDDLNFY